MQIPDFQLSKKLDDIHDIDCMVSKLAHSSVPVLAKKHQERFDIDEIFEVALLGRNGGEMTEWHREMLKRLFEQEELVEGIRQGIAELEGSEGFEGYDFAEEVKEAGGLLPWLYVQSVTIDALRETVYVSVNTEMDMNLHEHGMRIYWQNGEWHYELDEELGLYPCDVEGDVRYRRS